MAIEIILGDRTASVELVSRDNNKMQIKIDDKVYSADIEKVADSVYSIIVGGKSFNIELFESGNPKNYSVSTLYNQYDVEIIDAESRYLKNRSKTAGGEGENTISSPMPGKVVKIPVKINEEVSEGQTVIVVSAMKMESEYKAAKDGIVKEIYVKEGDTVDANQTLVLIE